MKLIVGLGNPGSEYVKTRHNVGFMVVDCLNLKSSAGFKAVKSDQFMNNSGLFVAKVLKNSNALTRDLYVVHDDLDIKLGEYKIQFGRGPKDHNGLKSIDDSLGTKDYWRVRVGVDNRPEDGRVLGEEYVLQNFTEMEMSVLDSVIKEICHKIK